MIDSKLWTLCLMIVICSGSANADCIYNRWDRELILQLDAQNLCPETRNASDVELFFAALDQIKERCEPGTSYRVTAGFTIEATSPSIRKAMHVGCFAVTYQDERQYQNCTQVWCN